MCFFNLPGLRNVQDVFFNLMDLNRLHFYRKHIYFRFLTFYKTKQNIEKKN